MRKKKLQEAHAEFPALLLLYDIFHAEVRRNNAIYVCRFTCE